VLGGCNVNGVAKIVNDFGLRRAFGDKLSLLGV